MQWIMVIPSIGTWKIRVDCFEFLLVSSYLVPLLQIICFYPVWSLVHVPALVYLTVLAIYTNRHQLNLALLIHFGNVEILAVPHYSAVKSVCDSLRAKYHEIGMAEVMLNYAEVLIQLVIQIFDSLNVG